MSKPNIDPVTVGIWAAVGLGVYALADKLGFIDKPGDGSGEGENDPEVDPETVPDLTAPTWTMQQAQTAALRIYGAIYGGGGFWTGQTGENEGAIVATLLDVQTDGDAALLTQVYGRRSGMWAWSGELTLPAALREFVSPAELQTVNDIYRSRNIVWSW